MLFNVMSHILWSTNYALSYNKVFAKLLDIANNPIREYFIVMLLKVNSLQVSKEINPITLPEGTVRLYRIDFSNVKFDKKPILNPAESIK